ncbi:hypothetical protein NVV93_02810 [Pseudomonas sp. LS44]|uniref:hypothetical protein n=1 Tax=Pseudomonas sp. LS44 TaxID=1357074 RepID=UPI00215A37B7|nr:hypothetical protein [Pseudomonas sp. LS44]UVE18350.1 hypothetical protein NVV93_02810 [Pseudomonas sp. LS44]
MGEKYYEVEGAVFREGARGLEVYSAKDDDFEPYQGDPWRVYRLSNPMSLEEVQPFIDCAGSHKHSRLPIP